MKSMLKDAGILFAITLVAGLLLGCVYQITKEPIARQEALAQENACREVFSDAESFEAVTDFTEEAHRLYSMRAATAQPVSMPVRRQRMRPEQYLVMC